MECRNKTLRIKCTCHYNLIRISIGLFGKNTKRMRYKIIGSKLRLGCAIKACDENTVLRLTVFISSFSIL